MKSQQFTLDRYLRGLDKIWVELWFVQPNCEPDETYADKVQFVTVNDDDEGQRIDNYLMRIIHSAKTLSIEFFVRGR